MLKLKNIRKVFDEGYSLTEHARLVYDVLWQLKEEGRLKTTVKPLDTRYGPVNRIFMWLED